MAKALLERQAGSNPIRFPLIAIHPEQHLEFNKTAGHAVHRHHICRICQRSRTRRRPEPHRTGHQHTSIQRTQSRRGCPDLECGRGGDALSHRLRQHGPGTPGPRLPSPATGGRRWCMSTLKRKILGAERPTYTLHGLQEEAYHACSVLTNNARYGQPTWPSNPAWLYLTVTDHGGSCPAFELSVWLQIRRNHFLLRRCPNWCGQHSCTLRPCHLMVSPIPAPVLWCAQTD